MISDDWIGPPPPYQPTFTLDITLLVTNTGLRPVTRFPVPTLGLIMKLFCLGTLWGADKAKYRIPGEPGRTFDALEGPITSRRPCQELQYSHQGNYKVMVATQGLA